MYNQRKIVAELEIKNTRSAGVVLAAVKSALSKYSSKEVTIVGHSLGIAPVLSALYCYFCVLMSCMHIQVAQLP